MRKHPTRSKRTAHSVRSPHADVPHGVVAQVPIALVLPAPVLLHSVLVPLQHPSPVPLHPLPASDVNQATKYSAPSTDSETEYSGSTSYLSNSI